MHMRRRRTLSQCCIGAVQDDQRNPLNESEEQAHEVSELR